MSKEEKKGVDNVGRRTWDKKEYAKKAEERKQNENIGVDLDKDKFIIGGLFPVAPADAAGPVGSTRAYLERRTITIDVDKKVNVKETVNLSDAVQTSGGYFCEVCECLLKDSDSYLGHINGMKHQRMLGYTMRVKQATVDEVKNKMDELKQLKNKKVEVVDFKAKYEAKMRAREEEEEKERENKRLEKVRKREEEKKRKEEREKKEQEENNVEAEEVDQEMMAMLGMGGFAT